MKRSEKKYYKTGTLTVRVHFNSSADSMIDVFIGDYPLDPSAI